ncbi:MAG: iron uptake porin [Pegethrix bostrychoides GSE-TBD4-15B]|jgi:hypothetical protein|uniref:Iron uptake porin n=1 Tax=Pegethrix bostrychoides GSE-TBD4-15B TaxID=2839662 RepID=A0A951P822_9CYAN|nr:iron uptake porin [Pegethrix bostrychoides GSE-TBD4-15B]
MLSKVLLNSVLATPALVGAALVISASAMAAEVAPAGGKSTAEVQSSAAALISEQPPVVAAAAELTPAAESIAPVAEPVEIAPAAQDTAIDMTAELAPVPAVPVQVAQAAEPVTSVSSLDQVAQYSSEGNGNSLSQVTSITQLSDVQPTDWAYQALQSLVERYGCIAGYPDGTYKGQRAMTRFEFAAGMNACLDRISELIAASTADLATKEDLATLQRLQEEFAAELAALRGRVDALEARTSELEANQFSTTTKLSGETIFAVGVPISGGTNNDGEDDGNTDDQTIAGYRVRLNFDTSFTGEDLLRARLQARDFGDFDSFAGNTGWQWGGGSDSVVLDDLLYTFPVGPAQIIVGANSIGDSDFVATTVSPFDSSGSGSLTDGLGTPPQYNFIPGGTGLGAIFGFGPVSLDVGYAASNAGDPSEKNGLFNGGYGGIAQLSLLTDFVDAAFTYSNSYDPDGFTTDNGYSLGGFDGGLFVDNAAVANIYGAQINFKLGFAELGGGAMYMPVRVVGEGDYRVWSYHGTLAFRDLLGDGNLLGFVVGVPPRVAGVDGSLAGDLGLSAGGTRQDASLLAEAFYLFRINDNISITPGIVYIQDPGNDNDNQDTFVGALRTTFKF